MADNYLERKMEEHGRPAPRRCNADARLATAFGCEALCHLRVLVVSADYEAVAEAVRVFRAPDVVRRSRLWAIRDVRARTLLRGAVRGAIRVYRLMLRRMAELRPTFAIIGVRWTWWPPMPMRPCLRT